MSFILLIPSALLNIVLFRFLYSIAKVNKKLLDEKDILLEVLHNQNQLQDENLEMYIRMLRQVKQKQDQCQQLF